MVAYKTKTGKTAVGLTIFGYAILGLAGGAQADIGPAAPPPMMLAAYCTRGDAVYLEWAPPLEDPEGRLRYNVYRSMDGSSPEFLKQTQKTHYRDQEGAQETDALLLAYHVTAIIDGQETLVSNPAFVTFMGASCVWVAPGFPPGIGISPKDCLCLGPIQCD